MWALLLCVLAIAEQKPYRSAGGEPKCILDQEPTAKTNDNQIVDLLYWHNKARRSRAKKGFCSNMVEMVWSDEVATVAQQFTDTCPGGHNPRRHSMFMSCATEEMKSECIGSFCLGENYAMGGGGCVHGGLHSESGSCHTTCDDAPENLCTNKHFINDLWWESEGGDNCKHGHCTQVTWQSSEFLGCGYKYCRNLRGYLLICNYLPLGNLDGYDGCTIGDECTNCPESHPWCNDGLCSRFNPDSTSNHIINPHVDRKADEPPNPFNIANRPVPFKPPVNTDSGSENTFNYVCDNGSPPQDNGCCAGTDRCPSDCFKKSMSWDSHHGYDCTCSYCPRSLLSATHHEQSETKVTKPDNRILLGCLGLGAIGGLVFYYAMSSALDTKSTVLEETLIDVRK